MALPLLLAITIVSQSTVASAGRTIHLSVSPNSGRTYNVSVVGHFKKDNENPAPGRHFGDIPELGQKFMNCVHQKNIAQAEGLPSKSCAETVQQLNRERLHRSIDDDSSENDNDSQEQLVRDRQKKQRPKQGKNRNTEYRRRKTGRVDSNDEDVDNNKGTIITMTIPRGRKSQSKIGACGDVHTMKAGEKWRFKIPWDSSQCQMGFEADADAELSLRCSSFSISSCSKEYFYIATEEDEKMFCGKSGPSGITGQGSLYVMYERLKKKQGNSMISCYVISKKKKPNGGSGSSDGSGGSGGGTSVGNGGISVTSAPQASKCNALCGKSNKGTGVTRIVGGSPATKGEYPWLVLVRIRAGGSPMQCGGSLITTTHVVTAAHCLEFSGITEVTVTAGDYNLDSSTESETQVISAKTLTQHPKYNPNTQANDIAVLTLAEPVKWTKSIAPICLGASKDHTGSLAVVAGWGTLTYVGSLPSTLQEVAVKMTSQSVCVKAYTNAQFKVTKSQVCAGSPNKDACQGDSGGPLIFKENNKWALIGIVSFGIGCAEAKYPGVYTRVSSYRDWILKQVSSGSC